MFRLVVAFVALLQAGTAPVPNTGTPPVPGLGARDAFTEFRLPSLQDHPGERLWRSAQGLQVFERAKLLKLDAHSATEAWNEAEETYRVAQARIAVPPPANAVEFNGTLTSALNPLLARDGATVRVSSPELEVDAPIRIAGSRISLDLGTAKLRAAAGANPYMLRIEGAQEVRVQGGEFVSGNWGVLVASSHNVAVVDMHIHDLSGGGIAVVKAEDVEIWRNKLHGLGAAAVLLDGLDRHVTVARNAIYANLGPLNWDAGVLLSDRDVDFAANSANLFATPRFWRPMTERGDVPQDNVIAFNHIYNNASSGLYSDGSSRNVIVGNYIEGNSKEGLCLDNGSTADVVAWNQFRGNGKRWGMSDRELAADAVLNLGRLPDGTSPAKLPGVSLDNALYNQIVFNEIDRNFGGGIKIVRTGLYNLIGLNLLTENNEGQSKVFHFFGIEMGAAKVDFASVEMNFTPSRGNEIFGNTIRGSHYAGIFFAEGSDHNDIFDNEIFGATNWAMESVRVQPNATLNNLTNLKSRNINAGLDPNLLRLSAGVMDSPPPPPPLP